MRPRRMLNLEARLKENLDFFIKIGTSFYKPVLLEPYMIKIGSYVFTHGQGLSFPTIVKVLRADDNTNRMMGQSARTKSMYDFYSSDVVCGFELVKPYGVYRVNSDDNKTKLIFASCSFEECCSVQEKWSESTDTKVASFYVATV